MKRVIRAVYIMAIGVLVLLIFWPYLLGIWVGREEDNEFNQDAILFGGVVLNTVYVALVIVSIVHMGGA